MGCGILKPRIVSGHRGARRAQPRVSLLLTMIFSFTFFFFYCLSASCSDPQMGSGALRIAQKIAPGRSWEPWISGARDNQKNPLHPEDNQKNPLHPEDTHKNPLHPEDTHKNELHPEDTHKNPLHPEDTHKNELHPEDTHKNPLHPEDTHNNLLHPEDTHKNPLHPDDTHKNPLHPEDTQKNPLHPEDTHKNPLHPEDTHKNPLHPEDAHKKPLHPEDTHKNPLYSEDAHNNLLHPEDTHKNTLHPEDTHKNPLHPEDANKNPLNLDGHKNTLHPDYTHKNNLHPVDAHKYPLHPEDAHTNSLHPEDAHKNSLHPYDGHKNTLHPEDAHKNPLNSKDAQENPGAALLDTLPPGTARARPNARDGGHTGTGALVESLLSSNRTPDHKLPHSPGGISVHNSFGSKKFPQAIIVGVKKGGTRALLEFLRIHPDVRALGAEPHFFDRCYDKGLEWYRNLMPRTLEGQITMEKTPSYFVTPEAPRRIYNMSKDTKLIVVVRNPVTRAVSDYTQTLSKTPSLPTFQALAFKNSSMGTIDTTWSAIRIGIYAKHLENWLQYFPLSKLLFVSGERLVSDPAGEMGRVQDFLGLKRIITDKHFFFNKTKGFPCLRKPEGSGKPRCLGKSKGRPHPEIDKMLLLRLQEFYRPYNMKFYQMTGHNFGWD